MNMKLYHASYIPVEKIDISRCERSKDFGQGFYLTTDINQARSFIKTSCLKAIKKGEISADHKYGYISVFNLDDSLINFDTFNFETADKNWLYYVAINRRSELSTVLSKYIPKELFTAELVSGKIANDTTNPVLTAFLSGLYGPVESEQAANTAISLLLPDRLKDQYCFKSDKAVSLLIYEGCEKYEY